MIAHLYGEVTGVGDRWAVIDVGGVGYRVNVPLPVARLLRGRTGKVKLHTHLAVREDGISLYGFSSPEDLDLFGILIGVSGIGPQIGLAILSELSVEEVVIAILREDEKTLTRVPGIGQKSARRLILELKEKMQKVRATLPETGRMPGDAFHDALSALVSLGFGEKESRSALDAAAGSVSGPGPEALVKGALAHLRGRS
ncbi:MAG: Holliday junction branch migration protein RuvA [Methanoregulaceae archaeon]|nr:Holliday junction branch migration protein RuvA [Methanoregulaceae archaeon]